MLYNQRQAAEFLGLSAQTIRNYERQGLLRRVPGRPGAWYTDAALAPFLGAEYHVAPQATGNMEDSACA